MDVAVCEANDSPSICLLLFTTAAPVSSQLVSIPSIVETLRDFKSVHARFDERKNLCIKQFRQNILWYFFVIFIEHNIRDFWGYSTPGTGLNINQRQPITQ